MEIVKPMTALGIQKAKPKTYSYALYDGNGLFLCISVADRKSWSFKYKEPSQEKYRVISIGRYPDLSLDEARKKYNEYRKQGCAASARTMTIEIGNSNYFKDMKIVSQYDAFASTMRKISRKNQKCRVTQKN